MQLMLQLRFNTTLNENLSFLLYFSLRIEKLPLRAKKDFRELTKQMLQCCCLYAIIVVYSPIKRN